jgi:hypothetical protein
MKLTILHTVVANSIKEVPCLAFTSILHNKAREIAKQRATE